MPRRPVPLTLLATAAALGLAWSATAQAQVQPPPPKVEESAVVPAPRQGAWMDLHEAFLKRSQAGPVDLLFLGDSITQGWAGRNGEGHGPAEVWERSYAPRNAVNYGIGGDRTQHVLWRLDHGEIDGIKPKVVVLMIGTNNSRANTPAEIAEGIEAIVDRLKAKLPGTKVLLLGVFPRGKTPDSTRERLKAVNERIARLDDGGKTVKYLDIGPAFLEPDGSIAPEVMPDFLHLTRLGYRRWADAMEPTLRALLGEG